MHSYLGVHFMVEYLLSMCKALGISSTNTPNKQRENNKTAVVTYHLPMNTQSRGKIC